MTDWIQNSFSSMTIPSKGDWEATRNLCQEHWWRIFPKNSHTKSKTIQPGLRIRLGWFLLSPYSLKALAAESGGGIKPQQGKPDEKASLFIFAQHPPYLSTLFFWISLSKPAPMARDRRLLHFYRFWIHNLHIIFLPADSLGTTLNPKPNAIKILYYKTKDRSVRWTFDHTHPIHLFQKLAFQTILVYPT